MEPQPQMQPINPVEGRPFAEPQQPLDLRPKRQPLDLRPRPNPRPLDVPDLRPARAEELRPSMNPLDRSNTQGAREAVGRVVNNPIGYNPGKALTWPLAVADRSGELHDELTQPNPMQTMDVPSIPLPDDSFPDLETSPTTKLSPDAIPGGTNTAPVAEPVGDLSGGLPGVTYKVILYDVRASPETPLFIGYVTGAYSVTWQYSWYNASPVLDGEGSTGFDNAPGYPYDYVQASDVGKVAAQAIPQNQPPPQNRRNPARNPSPFLDPDFLDSPGFADAPGFMDAPGFLPAPAPTGEIVPYQPPPWESPDRIPYTPPEKEPFLTPEQPPYPEAPPGRQPPNDTKKGTLAPPWWKAWEDFQPPDPWTNKKRRNPWPEDKPTPQLPPSQTPPPIAAVPYDGCCLETMNRLRDIQRRLEKLEVNSEIPIWACDTTADPPAPAEERKKADDLKTAINLIGESLGLIQQQFAICPPPPIEQAEHSEITKDTATEGKTVWYVPLPAQVRQVELIITGELPKSFRLYETSADGEQQAKFGALALSCSGVTGGHTANSFHQWCWTRRTSMYLGNRSPRENFLRVYVRSGLSWVLYDTGLRE